MSITSTDRVLATLPFAINTYGQGPGTVGNPVGTSMPVKIDDFKPTPGSGFQANLYRNPDTGQYTVAFAGTNDGLFGPDVVQSDRVLATANLLTRVGAGAWDAQFTDAIRFVFEAFQEIQREYSKRGQRPPPLDDLRNMVQVTGHSLGGSLAELVAQFYGLRGTNVDGPGVQALLGQRQWQDLKVEVGRDLQELRDHYPLDSRMFGAYAYTVVGVSGSHLDGIESQRTPAADAALASMYTAAGSAASGNALGMVLSAATAVATLPGHRATSILRETEKAAGLDPDAPAPNSPFTTLLAGGHPDRSTGEGPTMARLRLVAEQRLLQHNAAQGLSPTGLPLGKTTRRGPFAITAFADPHTQRLVEVRVPVDEHGQALGNPIRTEFLVDGQGRVGIIGARGEATFIANDTRGAPTLLTVDTGSPAQRQVAQRFKEQLGERLTGLGMSARQVDTLAAAAARDHTRYAGQGPVQDWLMSRDGNSIMMRQHHHPRRMLDVAAALDRSEQSHWAEAAALERDRAQTMPTNHRHHHPAHGPHRPMSQGAEPVLSRR